MDSAGPTDPPDDNNAVSSRASKVIKNCLHCGCCAVMCHCGRTLDFRGGNISSVIALLSVTVSICARYGRPHSETFFALDRKHCCFRERHENLGSTVCTVYKTGINCPSSPGADCCAFADLRKSCFSDHGVEQIACSQSNQRQGQLCGSMEV